MQFLYSIGMLAYDEIIAPGKFIWRRYRGSENPYFEISSYSDLFFIKRRMHWCYWLIYISNVIVHLLSIIYADIYEINYENVIESNFQRLKLISWEINQYKNKDFHSKGKIPQNFYIF